MSGVLEENKVPEGEELVQKNFYLKRNMSKNYYQILEITPPSSAEEIKKAFRRLAHIHHPDKGGSEDKFKEINTAYQTLSDQNKKRDYDNANGISKSGYEDRFSGEDWRQRAAQDMWNSMRFNQYGNQEPRHYSHTDSLREDILKTKQKIAILQQELRNKEGMLKILNGF